MTELAAGGFEDDEWRDWPSPKPPARPGHGDGEPPGDDERPDDWPLRSYTELSAIPGSVRLARHHARQVVTDWGFGEFSDAVETVLSELTTNAVKASADMGGNPLIRVWLLCDKARIIVLAWDASPSPPVRKDAAQDAENGRGLLIVEALSERWDWYPHSRLGGKVTWSEISVTGPPEPAGYPHPGCPE
jgi:anti-sigma regulatory factor (Ser/Thr protein kinase)